MSALVSDGAWQCSRWPLGPAGQGGLGWGMCVTPVQWRSGQPDASACLGSVCLEPSRVKIITTDWQGAWACLTQWAGADLPTSPPRTQPRPALPGAPRLFPARMGYWEIAENRVAFKGALHLSLSSQLNAWSGFGLTTPPKCPQLGAPQHPHPRGMASPGPPGRSPPAASSLC